ncbi:serine/threonine-protein kinase [Candidatus Uabimicrobium sp. HlEnr_7]|uniref:serine/threonine-protein kinase n=1 Tax=Candidatus Uabimicrobium helgolandensis TaxID=3095367 RepID=UPI003556A5FF
MAILSREQKWELQSGDKFSSHEIFSKLIKREIDKNILCRSEKSKKWKAISSRFRVMKSYGILHSIGQGGFGKVYKALEIKTKRIVALKVPTDNFLTNYIDERKSDSGKSKEQMKKEAKAKIGQLFSQEVLLTARLNMSPHVVSVVDHCVTTPYIALEYCSGGTLSGRMKKSYEGKDVLLWIYQIAKALDAAHSLQPDRMIHRDLKPSNVLIHDNVLKVSDFGTSKMSYDSKSLQSLDGGYTPFYAAPEAFDGKATCATDIWSLGVMMYQFVTRMYPFEGGSIPELIMKINFKPPVPLQKNQKISIANEVIDLINGCLEKKGINRPKASECMAIVDGLLHPESKTKPKPHVAPKIIDECQDGESDEDEVDFGNLGW